MAEKVKVWFDPEGDFLEVQFRDCPGYMRETTHDALPGGSRAHVWIGIGGSGTFPFASQVTTMSAHPISAAARCAASKRQAPLLQIGELALRASRLCQRYA